ncbi:MAG TPA: cation diffusion facilitator family transporter [Rudaea sp.]|jgi:cobalt-zinc-cadmium efflux system protein|nr:cation diffusion facilitator family transporter [Rudaea sp.]
MAHAHSHTGHTHHGHHHRASGGNASRLLIAFVLTLLTLFAEALGGWLSGSLALLADAGHMLVDAAALLLAWGGAHIARRPADARRSFGYARMEVLAGYTNALAQFALTAWIVYEAIERLSAPNPIQSGLMLIVAVAGLLVNALVLRVIGAHAHDDVNAAGARLHVLGDMLGSLAAVAAALLIRYLGWLAADPVLSILVALLILGNAWNLLRRSAHILLEGTPEDVHVAEVAGAIERETGIAGVHHVHIWQIAGGQRIATLHARVVRDVESGVALVAIEQVLRERFGITHATIQIEQGEHCAGEECRRHGQ